jgi:hypothetical protein
MANEENSIIGRGAMEFFFPWTSTLSAYPQASMVMSSRREGEIVSSLFFSYHL